MPWKDWLAYVAEEIGLERAYRKTVVRTRLRLMERMYVSYTVVKPEQRSRGSRTAIAGKMFKDGKEYKYPKGNGILYWSEVKRIDSPDTLWPLYSTLKKWKRIGTTI